MDDPDASSLSYLDGLTTIDDSLHDSRTMLYSHFGNDSSHSVASSSSFFLSNQSPTLLFSPYKDFDWMEGSLKSDGNAVRENEGEDKDRKKRRRRNSGRLWSDRMGMETSEERCRRMEKNRIRMAEKRARESEDERQLRLTRAKMYARQRLLCETEDERERRKELNRVRTNIRRGKIMAQKTFEESLRSFVNSSVEDELNLLKETQDDKQKRLETARMYAASKRMRETPEQRERRLEKNRARMREKRAGRKEEWTTFLSHRDAMEERLQVIRMQLGEKSPLLETDSILATSLSDLLKQLAIAPREKRPRNGCAGDTRSCDSFLSTCLPPLLTALEDLLRSRPRDSPFVFGADASYLDYVLYEELDALCVLSSTILDGYETLKHFKREFQQRLQLTTYAFIGSSLNLPSYESIDNSSIDPSQPSTSTVPF